MLSAGPFRRLNPVSPEALSSEGNPRLLLGTATYKNRENI